MPFIVFQLMEPGKTAYFDKALAILPIVLLAYLGIRLFNYMLLSFSWPMDGDLSFLYYIARLQNEHQYVPYRDIHETSFFGTFIIYAWLTKLLGYSTASFHTVNILFFSTLAWLSYLLLKPFGKIYALLVIGIFGEFYFSKGQGVLLQRDVIAILPAALSLLLIQSAASPKLKAIGCGALFGLASCIKPQFAGGLILVIVWLSLKESSFNRQFLLRFLHYTLFATGGFAFIWFLGVCWMLHHNILKDFISMVTEYLPAYSSINGRNYARSIEEAWSGAISWLSGTVQTWMIPLGLGAWIFSSVFKTERLFLLFIFLFWLINLSYVPMAGKYWDYHQLPSHYFLSILLMTPAIMPSQAPAQKFQKIIFPLFIIYLLFAVVGFSLKPKPTIDQNLSNRIEALSEDVADYLSGHLSAGDRIQPHTTHTRGPIFPALLQANVLPATPYLENYLFYHDVNSAFVRDARNTFMASIKAHPPRFVIYTPTMFPFRGDGAEPAFEDFDLWLKQHYTVVHAPATSDQASPLEVVEILEYQGFLDKQ